MGLWVPHDETTVGSLVIADSAAEETLYSHTIPAGALDATGVFRLRLAGNMLQDTAGNKQVTIRIKYGATTMFGDISGHISSDAIRRAWRMECYLFAADSKVAQRINASFALGASSPASVAGAGNLGGADTLPASVLAGEASEDSDTALDFVVTAQLSAADPAFEMVRSFGRLERLAH